MVELQSNKTTDIPVRELNDGQIGVITAWKDFGIGYTGRIIQRYGDRLITIGDVIDRSWDCITYDDHCRVRILEEGETLIITNNQ